ncbi:hypothetical protein PJE062_3729 [Pseudovibrio sp. JE062]|nr:hypothetical protein PJE062_3729 [Pseudovibrio sp. JE062]
MSSWKVLDDVIPNASMKSSRVEEQKCRSFTSPLMKTDLMISS